MQVEISERYHRGVALRIRFQRVEVRGLGLGVVFVEQSDEGLRHPAMRRIVLDLLVGNGLRLLLATADDRGREHVELHQASARLPVPGIECDGVVEMPFHLAREHDLLEETGLLRFVSVDRCHCAVVMNVVLIEFEGALGEFQRLIARAERRLDARFQVQRLGFVNLGRILGRANVAQHAESLGLCEALSVGADQGQSALTPLERLIGAASPE